MCLHRPLTQSLLPRHPPTVSSSKDTPPPPTAPLPHMWLSPAHEGGGPLRKNCKENKGGKGPKGQMSSPVKRFLSRKSSQSLYKANGHVDFQKEEPIASQTRLPTGLFTVRLPPELPRQTCFGSRKWSHSINIY